MALNIKDPETERLAAEVAEMTGDSKTGAVRQALRERHERLEMRSGKGKSSRDLKRWFETEIWSQIPEEKLGQPPLTKQEIEDILGYGPGGV